MLGKEIWKELDGLSDDLQKCRSSQRRRCGPHLDECLPNGCEYDSDSRDAS